MRRGLVIRGIVKDADGHPLAGAEVTLSSTHSVRAGRGGMEMGLVGSGARCGARAGWTAASSSAA